MKERRLVSVDRLLIEMGSIKQMIIDSNNNIKELKDRVGIQNGRVGKLETRNVIIQTATSIIGGIVTLILIPLAFILFDNWLRKGAPH